MVDRALDPISREYVALGFGIDRLVPGYVDAYTGPSAIKAAAVAGPEPDPVTLRERVRDLLARVEGGDYAASRQRYLAAQLRAMETTCRRLAGETLAYTDEVRGCFDIDPERTSEAVFDAALAALDGLLPGEGDVPARMISWRSGYEIAPDGAPAIIDLIAAETRRRTAAFVDLPPGEEVTFQLVSNQPWSGYNWYLGDFRSRVDINTDRPIHVHEVPALVAHEAYPGHHAEHVLKEWHLYRKRGYGEHTIQLINTPECVISEGIATLAESVIFTPEELAGWLAEVVYPAAGIAGDPEREAAIFRAQRALRAVSANAGLLLHQDGAGEDEVIAYLMRYGLRSEADARHSLSFLADPLWRPYIFTYHAGRDLLGQWLGLAPDGERQARFRSLLREQVTPSQVREWIAAGQA